MPTTNAARVLGILLIFSPIPLMTYAVVFRGESRITAAAIGFCMLVSQSFVRWRVAAWQLPILRFALLAPVFSLIAFGLGLPPLFAAALGVVVGLGRAFFGILRPQNASRLDQE